MRPEPSFRLIDCLRADLRRKDELLGLPVRPSWRRWLSAASPRSQPVVLCRLAYWFHVRRLDPIAKAVSTLNFVVFGIEISVRCPIGPGLFFPHTQGTVIGARRVGANATIYHGVTLGARELDMGYHEDARPDIADNVLIGSGAKILGGLSVGSGARIGANAVVLQSVDAGSTVAGVPARVVGAEGR